MMSDLSKTFIRAWENSLKQTLKIHQLEVGDVGCVVWDAALVLSAYLSTATYQENWMKCTAGKNISTFGDVRPIKAVELGAGTGIVGIQAAVIDARYDVTITDLPDLVPLMEKNIAENQSLLKGQLRAKALTWGEDSGQQKFDVILMADCIYYEESLPPLVRTLVNLSHGNSLILCCYEARTEGKNPETERKFFQLVKQHFTVEEVPTSDHDPEYRSPDIHILKFSKSRDSGDNR